MRRKVKKATVPHLRVASFDELELKQSLPIPGTRLWVAHSAGPTVKRAAGPVTFRIAHRAVHGMLRLDTVLLSDAITAEIPIGPNRDPFDSTDRATVYAEYPAGIALVQAPVIGVFPDRHIHSRIPS
jgi:hypothetical protein